MLLRSVVCTLAACVALSSCATPYKKKDEQEKKEQTQIKDVSKDTSYQAFVGRLRIGVNRRDRVTLTSMMTPDFGYRWDPAPAEESPFDYWEQNNLWPELAAALRSQFVPHEQYMVSEPTASGYRAGIRLVNGSWKFAYFVPPEEAAQ